MGCFLHCNTEHSTLFGNAISLKLVAETCIVGKGGHTPPSFQDNAPLLLFSKILLFLDIQDVPTFHRFIGKTKVLNNSCNQFVCSFYPQSILVLEERLQKW